jgi:hypothetical protein
MGDVCELFLNMTFRRCHQAYSAITGSILDILDPTWRLGGRGGKNDTSQKELVSDYLRVSGLFISQGGKADGLVSSGPGNGVMRSQPWSWRLSV